MTHDRGLAQPEPGAGDLLGDSGLFDPEWYRIRNFCDDPLSHFLGIGWRVGRDPGPGFNSRAYLSTYGDVSASGMSALWHYLTFGRAEGRSPDPWAEDSLAWARAETDVLRARLNVLGQHSALERLAEFAREGTGDEAAVAARELGLWHLWRWRSKRAKSDARAALDWAQWGQEAAQNGQLRSQMLTLLLAARRAAGQPAPEHDQIVRWNDEGLLSADGFFALAGFDPAPENRLSWINRALAITNVPALALNGNTPSVTAYDRLCAATRPDAVKDGPLVSVIIAAWQAEDTLPTALRAIGNQSWRNLEILVVDDASTDATLAHARNAARRDPRIRVFAQDRNQGAYAARNRALGEARGVFVTLQDADDWCHPERIAQQVGEMIRAPSMVACTAQHVRIEPDLRLARLSPECSFITANVSSILFRRTPVVERLGCWDDVRVGADSELIRRMKRMFGAAAVQNLVTGPLSFSRDRAGSAVRSGALAIDGHITGARLAYLEAQEHFHATASEPALRYRPGQPRPFPAPAIMQSRDAGTQTLSLVIAADVRRETRVTEFCHSLVSAARGPVGLFPLARLGSLRRPAPNRLICPSLRARLDSERLVQLSAGEKARAPLLLLPDPEALEDLPLPRATLEVAQVRLLALSPPSVTLAPTGRRLPRYDPPRCEAAADALSGCVAPEWWAGSHDLRAALAEAGASRVARRPFSTIKPEQVL